MKRIIPIVLIFAPLLVIPPTCKASIMARLCSSFTNVLDDEETKAAAAEKNCKKNCALIQKKHDLIKAAQKKVDDSCAKGISPDVTKVSAGLDKNVKAKLSKQYNQLSQMYDGADPNRPDKDFGLTTKSNRSPVSTGKGGSVGDLKKSDPDIKKLSPATEFGLSGTKLSGETPGQATTKQPSTLLASIKAAILPQKAEAASAKSPADIAASAVPTQKVSAAMAAGDDWTLVDCKCPDGQNLGKMPLMDCTRKLRTECGQTPQSCLIAGQVRNAADQCVNPCPDGKTAPDSKGNCPCGAVTYNPKESCCSADKKLHPGQVSDGKGGCSCQPGTGQVQDAEGNCGCSPDKALLGGICKPLAIKKAVDWAKEKAKINDKYYGKVPCSYRFSPDFCGEWKCNLFADDAFEVGAGVDFPHHTNRLGFSTKGPASANTLGDPNKVLSHYPVIPGGKESLQIGDIVAFPMPYPRLGHATIYIGKNAQGQDELVYAAEKGVIIMPFDYVSVEGKKPFVIRRYTP